MAEEKKWYSVVQIDDTNDLRKCWGPYEDYASAENVVKILVKEQSNPDEWLECLECANSIDFDGFWVNNVTGGGIYIMEMNL